MNKLLLFIATVMLASCVKLDDLVFPADNTITEYLFEDYVDSNHIELPSSFDLPNFVITPFTVNSQLPDEEEPTRIEAVYVGEMSRITTDTIIVYCHGQSKHMDAYWQRVKVLANCGHQNRFGVLMMDYRGYGLSEGSPTEAGLTADVNACLDWLIEQGAPAENVFLYGFSLGSAPATEIAAHRKDYEVAGLILEAPFASADNIAEESTLINVDAGFVVTLSFDNAEEIKLVEQPLMWLHGTLDDYISISNGELVYANHDGVYKEAHRVITGNHGDVPKVMGIDNYLDAMEAFLTR